MKSVMRMSTRNILIIGGGITGLSAAFYLQKEIQRLNLPYQVKLIEASERLGGKIRTMKRDGFTIEQGPDSLLSRKPAIMELTKELGLQQEMIFNETGQSYILADSKLHKMPAGTFMGVPKEERAILETEIFTEEGKKRALAEPAIEKGEQAEEQSLGRFMRRRFGDEAVNRLISPMLSGIHSGDIDEMSLMATYPLFYQLEQKYGSVMAGLQASFPPAQAGDKPKKAGGMFFSFKEGLETLIHHLEEELADGTILLETAVEQIEKKGQSYEAVLNNGDKLEAAAVIIATQHTAVPAMLSGYPFAKELEQIPAISTANVVMAFDEAAIENELEGTGFQVAREGEIEMTACTWTNKKWPTTTPKGKVLLRVYVGQPHKQEFMELTDDELTASVLEDLQQVMTIKSDPEFAVVTRWKNARPQYNVGHNELVARVREQLASELAGVQIAGSSYDGAGIPDCIANGKEAAIEALKYVIQ